MRPQKINVIVYSPQSGTGKQALAERVASVHADAVMRRVKDLNCPKPQKDALLKAVIETSR